MAPEQIRGDRVDSRTDVYALGCILYFALTGLVPFRRESDEARLRAHVHEPPPPSQQAPGSRRRSTPSPVAALGPARPQPTQASNPEVIKPFYWITLYRDE